MKSCSPLIIRDITPVIDKNILGKLCREFEQRQWRLFGIDCEIFWYHMLGYECYLKESSTLKIEMISHKMMLLNKDQAQGSAQHWQTIYHLKDFLQGIWWDQFLYATWLWYWSHRIPYEKSFWSIHIWFAYAEPPPCQALEFPIQNILKDNVLQPME